MKRCFEPGRAVRFTGVFFLRCRVASFLGIHAKNAKGAGHAELVLPLPPGEHQSRSRVGCACAPAGLRRAPRFAWFSAAPESDESSSFVAPSPACGRGSGRGNHHAAYLTRGTVTLAGLLLGALIGLILAPILPPIPKAEAATSTAGATAGAFDVSDSGAATYSIPIAVPPGVRGLQPSLALTYNSQNRTNGLLGIGWGLSGLSVIHRCGATIAIDGFKGGVNYDANDKFCLDGERLILYSGTEYRTEHESWQRVYASSTGTNPSYFTVISPDGGTRIYGGTTDSRIEAQGQAQGTGIARLWALNRVQDKRGNALNVIYAEDNANGDYRPTEISYVGGIVKVTFGYENRTDLVPQYEGGSLQRVMYRLSTVTTTTDATAVNPANAKQYKLVYDYLAQVGKSRLKSVQECGYDGTTQVCLLNPTTFTWQGPTGHVAASWSGQPFQNNRGDFADLNGDGRADFISVTAANTSLVSLSQGTSYGTNNLQTWSGYGSDFEDIDGDGRADALTPYGQRETGITNSGYFLMGWYLTNCRSTGTNFAACTTWGAGQTQQYDSEVSWGIRLLADVSGDGRPDMLMAAAEATSYFALNAGTGFSGRYTLGAMYTGGPWGVAAGAASAETRSDVNSDGRDDVVVLRNTATVDMWLTSGGGLTGAAWPAGVTVNPANTYMGDFNGDGQKDLLIPTASPYVVGGGKPYTVLLSTGKSFVAQTWGGGPYLASTTPGAKLLVGDFNGDGLDDAASIENGNYYISLSSGYGFTLAATGGYTGWASTSDLSAADINGDGMADLAAVSASTAVNNHALQLSTGTPDMMNAITNGQGAKVTVTYRPLTDPSYYYNYTTGGRLYNKCLGTTVNDSCPIATYPVKDVQDATYVVLSHTQSNGIGGTNKWDYSYEGLKYHHTAARSLGFYRMIVAGPDGIQQHTKFNQSPELAGLPSFSGSFVAAGSTWASYQYFTREFVALGGGRVLPRLTQTSTYFVSAPVSNAVFGSTTTTNSNWDASFPDLPQTVTTTTSDGYTKTATTTYNHDTVNWLIGRVSQTSVTSTAPSQPAITRTSSFTYGTGGATCATGIHTSPLPSELTSETVQPGGTADVTITTSYGYDVNGNTCATSVTGWDGAATVTRTTKSAFGWSGRFVGWTQNALGHTAYVDSYDTRFGAPTYARDVNGIATSAVYDGFGRKTSETQFANTSYPVTTTVTYATWSAPGGTGVAATTNTSGLGWSTAYNDLLGRTTWASSSGLWGANVWKYVSYDALGRKTAESLPYYGGQPSYQVTYTYDTLGRPITVARPLDAQGQPCVSNTTYNGLTVKVTNCKNQSVESTKNVIGWTMSTTDPGGTVTNTYDSAGSLKSVRDPVGNTSSMGYDLRGRKTSMTDPDMGSWTYAYNAFGELIRQQDAKAQVTTMTYDVLGRMKTRVRVEGTTTWTYDSGTKALGKLSSVSGPGYSESQTYDATRGLATTNSRVINGAVYTTTTQYDNTARPSYLTYPTGFKIENRYDGFGHLAEVWSNSLTTNIRYWKANTADATGAITQEVLGNSLTSNFNYDPGTGRLKTMDTKNSAGTALRNLSFSWDNLGNLTGRTWYDGSANRTESFTYDTLNRVTGVTGPANKTYGYNSIGNLTSKSDTGTYTYPAAGSPRPHAVTSIAGSLTTSFTYDANGNQLTGNGKTLTWTSFNKVKIVTKGSTTSTFAYGADDQRISKVIGTDTIHYVGKLYDRYASGSYLGHQHYVYAGSNLVGVYIMRNQGSPAAYMTYYHGDHLGSVDTVTGEGGGVAARFSFDAWGRPRNPNGTDNAAASTDYRGFTKHEHDDEIGLINMNAREYDPVIGRFVSADTIVGNNVPSQALNRYDYANNNPLSLIDPSGHLSKKWKKRLRKWFKGYVNYFLKPAAVAVAAVFTGGGALAAYATTAIASGFAAAGVTAGIAANIAAGISVVGGYAISGAAFGAISGGAICGSDCARAGARGGAISGGVLGISGIAAGLANGGLLGQATGSGINGWAQTGNSEGFARGFAAGLIPQDLGFSNAYMNNGAANIGIGIARDAARGYIVGGSDGVGAGVAWGQGTNAFGHLWGFTTSGFSGPTFRDGTFFYNGAQNPFYRAITFGNVITDATRTGALYSNTLSTDYARSLNSHELAHAQVQAPAMGAAYLPLHALSQGLGALGLPGGRFLEEAPFHPVPESRMPRYDET